MTEVTSMRVGINQNQKIALTIGGILVAILIILSVIVGSFWVWQRDSFGMMGRGMMGGSGVMFLIPILGIVALGLIIWVVVAAFHSPGGSGSTSQKAESPMDILKRRYAKGEINKEEYEEKKKDLV